MPTVARPARHPAVDEAIAWVREAFPDNPGEVDEFAWRAAKAFDGDASPPPPGDPRIAQRVRAIADEMFGPVPD